MTTAPAATTASAPTVTPCRTSAEAPTQTLRSSPDTGLFQAAADELRITQQAVSKRMAALERSLGVPLFVRSARGARLSADGQIFLPHARELVRVAARAAEAVRTSSRPLRIDVLNRRTAPATSLHSFHLANPDAELEVVTLPDADVVKAVADGTIDATFRALRSPRPVNPPLRAARAIDDRHQLLVGPRHPLADATSLRLADLHGHPIWMPGLEAGTEWASYYDDLSATFGLRIDTVGPSFGVEVLLDELAGSADLATLVGEGTRYLWPERYDLRRIPIVDPTPVYPHSIIWRDDNRHPVLLGFLDHLHEQRRNTPPGETWTPTWVR
ncbi:LysR family transcriptional regulator [Kribbella sp. NPDC048915]|uniref:LysR family transcriptional regulator n=1 Tax=Kribbella sp. NPDC048915 TaxID=3155148 RepID=UPI0033CF27ED